MKNNNKNNKNNKKKVVVEPNKMIFEIFVIVISITYLFYLIISKKTVEVFYVIFSLLALFRCFIKYTKKTFKYGKITTAKRVLYGFISLISVLLLFSLFMQYIIGSSFLLYIIVNKYMGILIVLYLLYIAIRCLIDLKKTKTNLIHNTVTPIFSLITAFVIILCYVIKVIL